MIYVVKEINWIMFGEEEINIKEVIFFIFEQELVFGIIFCFIVDEEDYEVFLEFGIVIEFNIFLDFIVL